MEHSQNDIRVSFMSWLGLLSSLVSLVSPLAAGAQSTGEQLALSLRHNVVSVVAERPGRVEEGFGFIVGEREGQVFIVTANHVVRGEEPGDVATRVAIRYFHDQRLSYEATLLERSDRTYDIALLRSEVPNDLKWHRASLGSQENVQRNAPVWFLGRARTWYVPTGPGRINDITLNFRLILDNLTVQPGTSGAPLIGESGILGLILSDYVVGCQKLSPSRSFNAPLPYGNCPGI